MPVDTREVDISSPSFLHENERNTENQPAQPSPHKATLVSTDAFVVTSPTGQIPVPLVKTNLLPTDQPQSDSNLPSVSDPQGTMKTSTNTGHRNPPRSDPNYGTTMKTRSQTREETDMQIQQPRSDKPRRKSTNVPVIPVPRGPDGKFLDRLTK